VRRQATVHIPPVSQQTIGRMTVDVVPDLLHRVERWRIGRQRFQVSPRMGLADRLDGGPPMHGAAVPEAHEVSPQMLPQRPQEVIDIKGLDMTRLEAAGDPQGLALGQDRESSQRRETVMSITVRDHGRVPLGSPRPSACGDEQKATLIQKDEGDPQAAGFF
jgi:hypothetical protein